MERAPAATASASWSEKATSVERSVVMGSFVCEWWREARREGCVGRRPGGIGRMARWLRRSHREARRAEAIPRDCFAARAARNDFRSAPYARVTAALLITASRLWGIRCRHAFFR